MKNKFVDLNNHLFAQLERLSEEDLTAALALRRAALNALRVVAFPLGIERAA